MSRPKIAEWFGKAPKQKWCVEIDDALQCFGTRSAAAAAKRRAKRRGAYADDIESSPDVMVELVSENGSAGDGAEATSVADAKRVAKWWCARGSRAIAHTVPRGGPTSKLLGRGQRTFYACAPAGEKVHKKWR